MKTRRPLFQTWIFCAATLAMGILTDTKAQAQPAVEVWVQRYNGPAESDDRAQKAVVDASGNVIVAGYSNDGITGDDWLIIKCSGAGVPLWTNRYNGPANGDDINIFQMKQSLALGSDGSVYVTGGSDAEYGDTNIYDFATIKYAVLPERPELVIQRATPDAIRICWPINAANYVLESKDQISTNVSWTPVITPVGIKGSNFCITNKTDGSNERFYRLRSGN